MQRRAPALDTACSSIRKSLCYKDASAKRPGNLSYLGDPGLVCLMNFFGKGTTSHAAEKLNSRSGFGKGTTSYAAEKLDSRSGLGKGTTSVVPISASPLCFPSGFQPARNLLPSTVRQRFTDTAESLQNMIYETQSVYRERLGQSKRRRCAI